MRTSKVLTLVVAVVVALSMVGSATAADGLSVSVSQDGDDVTVTVTQNNSSVADADVTVEAGENATYDDAGNYTTDDEGVVELSAPEENVTVAVSAAADNETASTSAALIAEDIAEDDNETEANESGGNVTDVDLNVTTDNGTVDYGNLSVNDSNPFGLYVSSFVHQVMGQNVSGPMGHAVATFATTFNPGNAPDHAGPPENKTQGPPENKTQGPPEDAGPPENKTQGPPENKTQGPPEDRGPNSDDSDGERASDDERRGPPAHAGPER
jgi:hypothetical protein